MAAQDKPPASDLRDDWVDGQWPAKATGPGTPSAFGIGLAGFTALWLFAAVAGFSDASFDVLLFAILFLIGLILALVWTLWSIAGRRTSRLDVALWIFVPASGLLGLMFLSTNLDLVLRLKLSESALNRQISSLGSSQSRFSDWDDRWVGLFRLRSAEVKDGCILFQGRASHPPGGLIYCTAKSPPRWSSHYDFEHLTGPWWSYVIHD